MKIVNLFTLFLLHYIHLLNICDFNDINVKSIPVLYSCQGYKSGHTFPCHCDTGMTNINKEGESTGPKTIVFNQCYLGRRNGAYHGSNPVHIKSNDGEMGLAVYSIKHGICGGEDRECFCTCFNQKAVEGDAGFRTSISIHDLHSNENDLSGGLVTDCLGLCGPHCLQGGGDITKVRYASILIHDVCQSFIRSMDPMPNMNACSDEGWSALPAAFLSLFTNGLCPVSTKKHSRK